MPRPGCGPELTTRANAVDLPPAIQLAVEVIPGAKVPLLAGEAEVDTWRIVEVFAPLPFELSLAWSAGSGSGAEAQITVGRSARICVFARSVRLTAQNLTTTAHRAGVTVADGFAITHNTWEVPLLFGFGVDQDVPIPPFAQTFRVEIAEGSGWATTTVEVFDGLNDVRATYNAAFQPASGVPVGGARKVRVSTPDPALHGRVVFHLSL
jgi:hypothetical protein